MILNIIIFSSHLLMPTFSAAITDDTGDHRIDTKCSSTSPTFTLANSNYSQSLKHLVDDLCANAPENNGFWNASWAVNPADRVYGLALCRGDITKYQCKACLTNASTEVVNDNHCPNSTGSIAWRDHCQLKYSNDDFLGKPDTNNPYYLMNQNDTSDGNFSATVENLLSYLSDEIDTTNFFFANGSTKLPDYGPIYGMVQCTRDLSVYDCEECLFNATQDLSVCCTSKVGARALYGSCNVRYETYQFLEN